MHQQKKFNHATAGLSKMLPGMAGLLEQVCMCRRAVL
jgi:hypothetical protein